MKRILLLCLIALVATGISANRPNRNVKHAPKTLKEAKALARLDSTYQYEGQGGVNDSILDEKTYYSFDSVRNIYSETTYEYDEEEKCFYFENKESTFYGADGKVACVTNTHYKKSSQIYYTYDSTAYFYYPGEIHSHVYGHGGVDQPMELIDSIVKVLNSVDSVISYSYYELDGTSFLAYKYVYVYDENNRLTSDTSYNGDNSSNLTISSYTTYTYDQGLLSVKEQYEYDNNSNPCKDEKRVYSYDAAKNNVSIYRWKGEGENWVLDEMDTIIYENNRKTEVWNYEFEEGGEITPDELEYFRYDNYGNLTDNLKYEYDEESVMYILYEHTQYFYTLSGTSLDDVQDTRISNPVVIEKYMINGILYIKRNGITYDAQGRIVK